MQIIEIARLPFARFGTEPCREIRLVASPWTTGSGMVIVQAALPPGSLSDEHVHPDADEYIHFDIGGTCVIDGIHHQVAPGTVVLARKGERHECRNISPDLTLNLYCVFSPVFEPYGAYPDLIARTKEFMQKQACQEVSNL
jgi:quercetin dioxygenase-like cupin family protein